MDQERWSRSLVKQHSGKKNSSNMEQSKSPQEISRYKHDIEQANAMRGRRAQQSSPTDKDVQLGLRGLEEADALHQRGDLDEALKLYGQSIELLLRCLKTSSPSKHQLPSRSFDHEVVSARVTVALSEAERIKKCLQERKSPQDASQPNGESPTSAWASISSHLSAALQRTPDMEVARPAANVSKGATGTIPRKSPRSDAPRRRTRLDYDHDPFVQVRPGKRHVSPCRFCRLL